MPGIIIGGSLGRTYTLYIQEWKDYKEDNEMIQNTVLGAAAMLCGYCRFTYSLLVMMLETIQGVDMFIPMLITMLVAYLVGKLFNQSLYFRSLRAKQVPFLKKDVPKVNINIRAKMVMNDEVYSLKLVSKVKDIGEILTRERFYYPVLNKSGAIVGSIS